MVSRRQAIKTAALTAGAAALRRHLRGRPGPYLWGHRCAPGPLAKGDGKADDTAAFQRALDACGGRRGPSPSRRATTSSPSPRYPHEVALVGVARGPISHNGLRDAGFPSRPTGARRSWSRRERATMGRFSPRSSP